MKFAVWLLVAAAILSLLALLSGELLPRSFVDSRTGLILGLDDPFRSWWFRILLGVLSLSLIVCIIERAPMLIRQAFMRTFRDKPDQLASFDSYRKAILADGETGTLALFRGLGFSTAVRDIPGGKAISGTAGGISRLGPLLSHLGMLLLILGGLAVSITGESVQLLGRPGDVLEQPGWGFQVRVDDFRIDYYPVKLNMWVETENGRRGKVVEMRGDSAKVSIGMAPGRETGFWFSISKLKTDFLVADERSAPMPFQGNVKSYVSSVTVLKEGREAYRKEVAVNAPLREGGYRFYQSSFQPMAAKTKVDSVVLHADYQGAHFDVVLSVGGGRANLPWGNYEAEVFEFFPDFRLDENFKPFSASDNLLNPAARVQLYKDGQPLPPVWAFGRQSGHTSGGEVQFTVADVRGVSRGGSGFATVLEVNHDRGGFLVWAGFVIMTLGLMLAYMTSQRQAWAVVMLRGDGRDEVHLAAAATRDHEHFLAKWSEALDNYAGGTNQAVK